VTPVWSSASSPQAVVNSTGMKEIKKRWEDSDFPKWLSTRQVRLINGWVIQAKEWS